MISPLASQSLRSSLRQTRGALRTTNRALQSLSLSESERRVLTALRTVQLEVEQVLVGMLSDAQGVRRAA